MLLIENNLALHYLTILRDKNTPSHTFKTTLERLSEICAVHVLNDFPSTEITIQTPLEETQGLNINSHDIVLLPILRAGMGMYNGFSRYLSKAQSAFVAQKRDEETAEATQSYFNIPDNIQDKFVFILDPMLATGGSVANTINMLKDKYNVPENKIVFISIVSSPEGMEFLSESFPDLTCFTVSVDRELNNQKFILPGLGDAGDRIYNSPHH